METTVMNLAQVEVNAEGYLKNMNDWTPDLAREIAALATRALWISSNSINCFRAAR
jgi:sulfur relay (sulfurtransferase) DsrC/TusE family protein